MAYKLFFILIFSVATSFANIDCNLAWFAQNSQASHGSINQKLVSGKITRFVDLKVKLQEEGREYSGTSQLYFVEIEGGVKAVFRPEIWLWSSAAEVGAYRLSNWLGINLVPETVFRTINGTTGSLQLYKESAKSGNSKQVRQWLQEADSVDAANLILFHFLIGNWDLHAGNFLFDRNGRPVAIDNEGMMNLVQRQWGGGLWVKEVKSFGENVPRFIPLETLKKLKQLDAKTLKDLLPPTFTDRHIQLILERLDIIIQQARAQGHQTREL